MTAPRPAAQPVRHVGCPSCGATLPRREDARTLTCRACGTRCVLDGVEVASRFQVVPKVERSAALATVRSALGRWPVRSGTDERAAVVSCELFWVPFYEYEAVQAGTVLRSRGVQSVKSGRVDWTEGRRRFVDAQGREISEEDHYRRRRVDVKDTAVVLRSHRASGPAGGPRDWGLSAIDLTALREDADVRIVPRGSPEAPAGHVLSPTIGPRDAEAEVMRVVGAGVRTDYDLLAPDLRYVFVPVWVVRLRVDRHPYAFVVDGVHGRILSGRAPEAPRRGALFVVLAAAYIGLPLGKLAAMVLAGSTRDAGHIGGVALALLANLGPLALLVPVLLLFPLAFAWGEFRFRGEVAFGPGGARVVKSSRPQRTFLERLIDRLVAATEKMTDQWGKGDADRDGTWGGRW